MRTVSKRQLQSVLAQRGRNSQAPHLWDGLKLWMAPLSGGYGNGGNPYDWSGQGNILTRYDDATPNAGPTWERGDGQWPYAMSFDGSNDYTLIQPTMSSDSKGTISAWVKLNTLTHIGTIFQSSNTGFTNRYLSVLTNSGELQFLQNTGTTSFNRITTSAVMSTVSWTHVCVLSDGVGFWMYANGEQVFYVASAGAVWFDQIAGLNFTNVGRLQRSSGHIYDLDAKVFDLRIFNRALSPSEIQQLHYDPTAAARPRPTLVSFAGLTGTWKFWANSQSQIIGGGTL